MKGILLVNTGSPQTCTRKHVKAFVGAMLSDPMVLTVPNWFRPILVHGLILPFRQFKSTAHYELIWDKKNDASPLLYHMQQLAEKLREKSGIPVEVGMRYEEPNIPDALNKLEEAGVNEVIVLPLFPHYAESSYATTVKEVKRCFELKKYTYGLHFIEPYFNDPHYIKALANSIKPYLEQPYDKLLFTYHSLPLSHIEAGRAKGKEFDYVYQTKETTRLVLGELGIPSHEAHQVYSSAMGGKWLEPSLETTVHDFAEEGAKRVIAVSAGFSVDNLETMFDVGVEANHVFEKAGGVDLVQVPCLNSEDYWVQSILKMVL